jgi:hypothetical protein
MGAIRRADPDQMFYDQSVCTIQFKIPEKDALGEDEGGRFL